MQQVCVARNVKSSTPLRQICNGVDRNGVDDFNLFHPVQPPASDVELKQMLLLRWIYNAFIIMIISCYGYLFIKMHNRGDGIIKLLTCFFFSTFFHRTLAFHLSMASSILKITFVKQSIWLVASLFLFDSNIWPHYTFVTELTEI